MPTEAPTAPTDAGPTWAGRIRVADDRERSQRHSHREQEEAYLVISGSGEMLLDGDVIELGQWDLVRVAPTTVRAFAAGADGMEIIAVGGPKPEGGDGETSEANWPNSWPLSTPGEVTQQFLS